MKKILIIGIGAGNPDYVTIQAVNALNQVDVFFILDKGAEKSRLIELRKEICRRYIQGDDYRFVDATSPQWDRTSENYLSTVDGLNRDKQVLFERLITSEMRDGECGAFLVWGDPTLYDSTIRIIATIAATGRHDLEYEMIPGISSVQALAARHKTSLNHIGRSIEITTGRRLAEGFPNNADCVVVMLDADNSYRRYADQEDIEIHWGAYLGTPDEILVAGKLKDVVDDIERLRAEARLKNGWVMDTYLLRRSSSEL
ncbi:precorrin-6A synthase (deacetylating) [Nitrospirillum amazonense]|uniref:Precorrin-6A synthase [deacetylating] n=1 Tax=Nitrospirillum amazonense TaxID=28077 RepID=A0A560FP87_9PROT|nr:precorrin-6A synthase (deacetylating) [Nitrospirillum amazonense]TWB23434.1 precorrin-6A synthase (deacetylating) [Nitrospirillum amazonense]